MIGDLAGGGWATNPLSCMVTLLPCDRQYRPPRFYNALRRKKRPIAAKCGEYTWLFQSTTIRGAVAGIFKVNQSSSVLDQIWERAATGKKVNSPRDNAAIFAIAKQLEGVLSGATAVKGTLAFGEAATGVAISASAEVSDLLIQAKAKALQASQEGLDPASRQALEAELQAITEALDPDFEALGTSPKFLVDTKVVSKSIHGDSRNYNQRAGWTCTTSLWVGNHIDGRLDISRRAPRRQIWNCWGNGDAVFELEEFNSGKQSVPSHTGGPIIERSRKIGKTVRTFSSNTADALNDLVTLIDEFGPATPPVEFGRFGEWFGQAASNISALSAPDDSAPVPSRPGHPQYMTPQRIPMF